MKHLYVIVTLLFSAPLAATAAWTDLVDGVLLAKILKKNREGPSEVRYIEADKWGGREFERLEDCHAYHQTCARQYFEYAVTIVYESRLGGKKASLEVTRPNKSLCTNTLNDVCSSFQCISHTNCNRKTTGKPEIIPRR